MLLGAFQNKALVFGLLFHFQVYFLAVLRIHKTPDVKARKQDEVGSHCLENERAWILISALLLTSWETGG